MASNPFKQNKNFELDPKRSSFDLSFSNNFTANFGTLIPIFCKEVIPGDYFDIKSALALRAMPLPFPVQTRCKAYVHFFYQRNKNLWKDWQDFIAGNKPHVLPTGSAVTGSVTPPYIVHSQKNASMFMTGGLGDYLGLPTINYANSSEVFNKENFLSFGGTTISDGTSFFKISGKNGVILGRTLSVPVIRGFFANIGVSDLLYTQNSTFGSDASVIPFDIFGFNKGNRTALRFEILSEKDIPVYQNNVYFVIFADDKFVDVVKGDAKVSSIPGCEWYGILDSLNNIPSGDVVIRVLAIFGQKIRASTNSVNLTISAVSSDYSISDDYRIFGTKYPISAFRFRCYESIYNSFYRDARNNPFFINGVESFNEFLPSRDGGLDDNLYELRKRNWELDQFTSCVPTPQQGIAPLVGFSNNGDLEYQNPDGTSSLIAKLNSDGDLDSAEVKSAVKQLSASLSSLASSGISINDFRNVNAYQRWKETNIRRGLKYKDQIKARWGVDIKESILDMPEFIGGFAVDVDVNTVSQTTGTANSPLGDYAGQMSAFGRSDNAITQYCDDYGYIMGIISIVPTTSYESVVPKDFYKFSPLDYFSPEFDNIGMQPVPYKELVGVLSQDGDFADDTFGYQRPWYDYLSSLDECHGLFRTEFQNFLISREFKEQPLLGPSFTTIDYNDLNNVFYTDYGDKFLGQIYFNVEAKRPISKISIPSLE